MQMRELLAELVTVESEIARLECQISQLQAGLRHEQEVTKESKSKIWNQGNLSNSNNHLSTATITNPSSIPKSVHERMAFETKALHFISKAIKGDYDLNDFSFNDKTGFFKNYVQQKENNSQEDVKFQERLSRKNGVLKPPSPMRDPRHPSPKVCRPIFPIHVFRFIFLNQNQNLFWPHDHSITKDLPMTFKIKLIKTKQG